MASNQSTMTEFSLAPGEQNLVGEHFSPNILLFQLKTSVAASYVRVQYRSPNTILGIIPLGSESQTIPLRNIASVDTSTKFNMGSFLFGVVFIIAGFVAFGQNSVLGFFFVASGLSEHMQHDVGKLEFYESSGW